MQVLAIKPAKMHIMESLKKEDTELELVQPLARSMAQNKHLYPHLQPMQYSWVN